MSTDIIQANYTHLDEVAARFGQHADLIVALDSRVRQGVQALADGGWEGAGSAAFLAELQGEVFPALQRFRQALEEARAVTLDAKIILQRAEEEAARVFQGDGADMRSAASGDGKPDGGLWGSIGEWVHGTLDVAGFVPGLGEIADGVNALIYLAEGRYVEAAISAAAMIPIVGDAGKAGKWGVKAGKEILEEAAETGAERVAKEAAEGVSERQLRAGAGGNWPVINEIRDLRVVQQTDNLSCGAACGEMVLKDRGVQIPQNVIAQQGGGVPMSAGSLKDALNALDKSNVEQWRGGFIDIPGASDQQIFATLSQTGSWVAILYEGPGAKLAHAVVVDGMDAAGRAMIRDPWNGTSYLMNSDDFLNVWTSQAVFRSK